jgi:hypothetical protein
MSRYSDQIAASTVGVLFQQHGDEATVLPAAGPPQTITAVIAEEVIAEETDDDGRKQVRTRVLTVCTDPSLGYGHITPAIGLVIRLGDPDTGTDYRVSRIDGSDPPLAVLTVSLVEDLHRTKPGFRK